MKNLALIAEGGTMRGAFVAGVMKALDTEVPDFTLADINTIVASSASAASTFYFINDRGAHAREIWTQAVVDSSVFDIKKWWRIFPFTKKAYFDSHYLSYKVFKKKYPLTVDVIRQHKQTFCFPLYNSAIGRTEFFCNTDPTAFSRNNDSFLVRDWRSEDVYDLIYAAIAIPTIGNGPVTLTQGTYLDGGMSESYTLDMPYSKERHKIIIVSDNHATFAKRMRLYSTATMLFIYALFSRKSSFAMAKEVWKNARDYQSLRKEAEKEAARGTAIIFRPTVTLPSRFDNTSHSLRKSFDHGYDLVKQRRKEIKAFVDSC